MWLEGLVDLGIKTLPARAHRRSLYALYVGSVYPRLIEVHQMWVIWVGCVPVFYGLYKLTWSVNMFNSSPSLSIAGYLGVLDERR